MIGKTISHYKIIEKLGEGGMGVVYKAEDTKLKRDVALKFLPKQTLRDEESKARFIREAQAAAKLEHPNICTVYEIDEAEGHTFIAMAYLEGETLQKKIRDEKLRLEDVIDIAVQISEGLRKAHSKKIIHRDIKSSNIMITPGGRAMIMDFGLAKSDDMTRITTSGSSMGTVAYMSPEQARGEDVSFRTDIWSFGIVVYEMLTGELPFQGNNMQSVIYKILSEEPEPVEKLRPDLPSELCTVARKTMEKETEKRYRKMTDIIFALEKIKLNLSTGFTKTLPVGAKTLKQKSQHSKRRLIIIPVVIIIILAAVLWFIPEKPGYQPGESGSIVVLPFADMSPGKDQEYFCDGISEEIINALSKFKDLRVIARTSAFYFKGRNIDVREIGEKLEVDTLLEGSVRKSGNKLKITAQLINVSDGYHIWSDTYNRTMDDVFEVQEEIARAIVTKLKIELTESHNKAGLIHVGTKNLEAYEYYLKGMHLIYYGTSHKDSMLESIKWFEKAIEHDPQYAEPYAQMASSYTAAAMLGSISPKEAYPKAKAAMLKALMLDSNLAAAWEAKGRVEGVFERKGDARRSTTAMNAMMKAVELDPSYVRGRISIAVGFETVGRYKVARPHFEIAYKLDPLSNIVIVNVFFSRIGGYNWSGAEEVLIKANRAGFRSNENYNYYYYPMLLLILGRTEEAEAKIQEGLKLNPESINIKRYYGQYLYVIGRYDKALEMFEEINKKIPNNESALNYMGQILVLKGQYKKALDIFRKTGNRYWESITLGRMGRVDSLRSYIKEIENTHTLKISGKKFVIDEYCSYFWIACLYAELDYKEKAFEWLEKAYDVQDYNFGWELTLTHLLDKYRSESRYEKLLKGMGLK